MGSYAVLLVVYLLRLNVISRESNTQVYRSTSIDAEPRWNAVRPIYRRPTPPPVLVSFDLSISPPPALFSLILT